MGLKEKFEKETRGDDEGSSQSSEVEVEEEEAQNQILQRLGSGGTRKPLCHRSISLSPEEIASDLLKLRSEVYAGSSPASGSGTSTFLASESPLPSSANTGSPGFRAQSVAGQIPSFTFNGNSVRNMSPQSPMAYGGFAAFARGNNPFSSIIQPVGQQFASGQVTPRPPIGLGIQVAENSNIQSVMTNQIPVRSGFSQARLLGTQKSGMNISGRYQAPNVRHPMSFSTGQGIPSANVAAVGISQASNIHGQPPRGRRGLESFLASWSTVRPRTKPIPNVPPALSPVVEQESPADSDSTASLESSPSPDSTPLLETVPSDLQPTGEQCWLCKRDVEFAPDRPLSQPAMAPVVAVLPCHHVFHAQCLEKITPKEQAENPPCILCAIREP